MHTQLSHEDYLKLSERTMGTNFYINNQSLVNILHGAIGVQTEVTELFELFQNIDEEHVYSEIDGINLAEEIGDILWYEAILMRELDIKQPSSMIVAESFSKCDADEFQIVLNNLNMASGQLLDMLKKKCFYDRSIVAENVAEKLTTIRACCYWFLDKLTDQTFESVRATNINKLQTRFPEKFTTEDANNRDLEKERRVLEGNVKSEELGLGYV